MKEIESAGHFNADYRNSETPVIVDFYASWCGPCQTVQYLIADHEQTTDNVVFVKVDVDLEANSDLLRDFKIKSIPTLIRLEGGKEVDRIIGTPKKDRFMELVNV